MFVDLIFKFLINDMLIIIKCKIIDSTEVYITEVQVISFQILWTSIGEDLQFLEECMKGMPIREVSWNSHSLSQEFDIKKKKSFC